MAYVCRAEKVSRFHPGYKDANILGFYIVYIRRIRLPPFLGLTDLIPAVPVCLCGVETHNIFMLMC